MAATVTVEEMTGAGPTYTEVNVTNPSRYCTTDNVNSEVLANPCVIPAANFGYSYWKHHCLNLQGSFTRINNIRWYTDGACSWTYGANADSGIRVAQRSAGDHGVDTANYDEASGTPGTTGDNMFDASDGHAFFKSGVGATPEYMQNFGNLENAMTVDSTNHDATGYSKAVVTQVWISTDATQGLQADETFTFVRECS
jgi:hypothetical protein